jgi:hypothetical protein
MQTLCTLYHIVIFVQQCRGCLQSPQDTRNIQPDPCDNRIIRFNNCLQLLSCACSLLSVCFAMCMVDCGDLARWIDVLADWVFLCTASCMHAQTDYELNHKPDGFDPWAVPTTYLPTGIV